jgi:hypothetical protein
MAIDLDESKIERHEFRLWLGWTLATAIGMILGFLPSILLVDTMPLLLARILVPLLAGFLIGFAQWIVLRYYVTSSHDWILTAGAGWALGYVIGLTIVQFFARIGIGAWIGYILFGIIIALAQWPILRREVPHLLTWVLANVVGWTLGFILSNAILNALFNGPRANLTLVATVGPGLSGLISGAIIGLALVLIVRQPEQPTLQRSS